MLKNETEMVDKRNANLTINANPNSTLGSDPTPTPTAIQTQTRPEISIEVQALNYPAHFVHSTRDANQTAVDEEVDDTEEIDTMLATIFVLSMVPTFFTVVEGPVSEKENGFKVNTIIK